jgi:hypothetical protein
VVETQNNAESTTENAIDTEMKRYRTMNMHRVLPVPQHTDEFLQVLRSKDRHYFKELTRHAQRFKTEIWYNDDSLYSELYHSSGNRSIMSLIMHYTDGCFLDSAIEHFENDCPVQNSFSIIQLIEHEPKLRYITLRPKHEITLIGRVASRTPLVRDFRDRYVVPSDITIELMHKDAFEEKYSLKSMRLEILN